MAKTNVKVVQLDTQPAQTSVKELRSQLKALKDAMLSAEQGTEEYNQALLQAAEIQHTLKEQTEQVNASAMDFGQIASNVSNSVGGMVAGFQAAKGVMNLFGVENEAVLESLQKMQSLMAITQAFPGIDKGIKSMKNLVTLITTAVSSTKSFDAAQKANAVTTQASAAGTQALSGAMKSDTVATTTATVATNTFKKALVSIGIGAVVVLLGALIANLDKVAKFFGISTDKAEQFKKKLVDIQNAYKDFNATLQQYDTLAEGVAFTHKAELDAMDDNIAKMKAEGASAAQVLEQREKDLARRKEIAEEQTYLYDIEKQSIQERFNTETNEILTVGNAYMKLSDYQKILSNEELRLQKLKEKGNKKQIAQQEVQVEQAKQMVSQIQKFINLQKEENAVNDAIKKEEKSINNERIANRKKAKEDLEKLDEDLLIKSLKNREKELAQVDKTQKDELKKLEDMYKNGAMKKEGYEKRKLEITNIYNQQRSEIEYKYIEKDSKRYEEALKQQANITKQGLQNELKVQEQAIQEESNALGIQLKRREITFTEYYAKETELARKNYENRKKVVEQTYKEESNLISNQIDERNRLLATEGISEEQKQKILSEVTSLMQELQNLDTQYKVDLQNLSTSFATTVADNTESTIQSQMDSLRTLTDGVVSAMDAITSIGEGVSSEWATAFDTMANGLINLGQKVKEGTANWEDYGQMAVAGISAASSVMNALADEQDTNTKEGFEQQKKYQIAAATMNMLGGIVNAWVSAFSPANEYLTTFGQIAMGSAMSAMILGTSIAQIQKIQKQQFGGGSSSASATPNTSAISSIVAPVQYTQDVNGANIEGAIKDQRVYVVESDITSAQKKVHIAESESKF